MLRGPGVNSEMYGTGKDGRVLIDASGFQPHLTDDVDATELIIGDAGNSRTFSTWGYRLCATRAIRFIGSTTIWVPLYLSTNATDNSGRDGGPPGGGAGGDPTPLATLGYGNGGGAGGVGGAGTAGAAFDGYGGAGGDSGAISGGALYWKSVYGSVKSQQMLRMMGWSMGYADTEINTIVPRPIGGGAGGAGGSATGASTGGGGGGGGGVLWISVPTLIVDAGKAVHLRVPGGNGGLGYKPVGGGTAYGGGGGGGGLIILHIGQLILGAGASLTAHVEGGLAGYGTDVGMDGNPGSPGHVLVFTPDTVYDNVNGGAGVTVVTA